MKSSPRSPRGRGSNWAAYKRTRRAAIAEEHGVDEARQRRRNEKRRERVKHLLPIVDWNEDRKTFRVGRMEFTSFEEIEPTLGVPVGRRWANPTCWICTSQEAIEALRLAAIGVPLGNFSESELQGYAWYCFSRVASFSTGPRSSTPQGREFQKQLYLSLGYVFEIVADRPLHVAAWFASLSAAPSLFSVPEELSGPIEDLLLAAAAVRTHLRSSRSHLACLRERLNRHREALAGSRWVLWGQNEISQRTPHSTVDAFFNALADEYVESLPNVARKQMQLTTRSETPSEAPFSHFGDEHVHTVDQ